MAKIIVAVLLIFVGLSGSRQAFAQKEVVGMLAMLSLAPEVCSWTDAASSMKIDMQIDAQIASLGMSADDWRQIRNAAKAALVADPANCKDVAFRAVYDEAAK